MQLRYKAIKRVTDSDEQMMLRDELASLYSIIPVQQSEMDDADTLRSNETDSRIGQDMGNITNVDEVSEADSAGTIVVQSSRSCIVGKPYAFLMFGNIPIDSDPTHTKSFFQDVLNYRVDKSGFC